MLNILKNQAFPGQQRPRVVSLKSVTAEIGDQIFMKYKTISIALLINGIVLLFSGCFNSMPSPPKENLPETIGKWHKGDVIAQYLYEQNGGEKYSNFEATYSAEPGQPIENQSSIRYILGIHKNAEEAAKEQAAWGNRLANGAWKTGMLNDQTNKAVGTMSICRQLKEDNLSGEKNYVYSFIFSNENRLIRIEPLIAANVDLIEFTKALPFNSQVDLSMIDSLSSLENLDGLKLMSLSPPVKTTKEPYLKGKTVVVDMSGVQTGNYIADSNKRAEIVNEMQSLIQIRCAKGDRIGQYELIETKEIVPAYGSQCKVTVIDHTIPAIITEKTFFNKELPPYRTFYQSLDPKRIGKEKLEYAAPFPQEEVKNFITGLPNR